MKNEMRLAAGGVNMKQIIIHNRIRCRKCGEMIESETVHDFRVCSCGACAVDGGKDYLRRCGSPENWEDCSEVIFVRDNKELRL